jgi:hypothetical protein
MASRMLHKIDGRHGGRACTAYSFRRNLVNLQDTLETTHETRQ